MAIRLRNYDNDGTPGRPFYPENLDWSAPFSEMATLKFSVRSKLAIHSAVAVETWNGIEWKEPDEGRFTIISRDSDPRDPSGIITYDAANFVWFELGKAVHRHSGKDPIKLEGAVGSILKAMLLTEKALGWAPLITWDFDESKDSAGTKWPAASDIELESGGGETLRALLEGFAGQASCEVITRGTQLILLGNSDGKARNARVGSESTEAPNSLDGSDTATHVLVRGDEGRTWEFTVPGATGARRTSILEAPGVTTESQARRTAKAQRAAASGVRSSWTISEQADSAKAIPGHHYQVGERVWVREAHGWERRRVMQIQMRLASGVTITDTIVDARNEDRLSRLLKRATATRINRKQPGTQSATTPSTPGKNPEWGVGDGWTGAPAPVVLARNGRRFDMGEAGSWVSGDNGRAYAMDNGADWNNGGIYSSDTFTVPDIPEPGSAPPLRMYSLTEGIAVFMGYRGNTVIPAAVKAAIIRKHPCWDSYNALAVKPEGYARASLLVSAKMFSNNYVYECVTATITRRTGSQSYPQGAQQAWVRWPVNDEGFIGGPETCEIVLGSETSDPMSGQTRKISNDLACSSDASTGRVRLIGFTNRGVELTRELPPINAGGGSLGVPWLSEVGKTVTQPKRDKDGNIIKGSDGKDETEDVTTYSKALIFASGWSIELDAEYAATGSWTRTGKGAGTDFKLRSMGRTISPVILGRYSGLSYSDPQAALDVLSMDGNTKQRVIVDPWTASALNPDSMGVDSFIWQDWVYSVTSSASQRLLFSFELTPTI